MVITRIPHACQVVYWVRLFYCLQPCGYRVYARYCGIASWVFSLIIGEHNRILVLKCRLLPDPPMNPSKRRNISSKTNYPPANRMARTLLIETDDQNYHCNGHTRLRDMDITPSPCPTISVGLYLVSLRICKIQNKPREEIVLPRNSPETLCQISRQPVDSILGDQI